MCENYMSKYYYHGIKDYYDPNTTISKILEIIESGGIKSRLLQGKTSNCSFNGDDYIRYCREKDYVEDLTNMETIKKKIMSYSN